MNHGLILPAIGWLPTDQAAACVQQLGRLDARIAALEATEVGDPEARETLHQCHCDVQALYHEASGHPAGGRPDVWHLSVLKELNRHAARLGLDLAPMPFSL